MSNVSGRGAERMKKASIEMDFPMEAILQEVKAVNKATGEKSCHQNKGLFHDNLGIR